MMRWISAGLALLAGLTALPAVRGEETAAERGKNALLGKSFNPPTMALSAYDNAWKHWGLAGKPAPPITTASSASVTDCIRPRIPTPIYPWGCARPKLPWASGARG